jgi:hypothetical protein
VAGTSKITSDCYYFSVSMNLLTKPCGFYLQYIIVTYCEYCEVSYKQEVCIYMLPLTTIQRCQDILVAFRNSIYPSRCSHLSQNHTKLVRYPSTPQSVQWPLDPQLNAKL